MTLISGCHEARKDSERMRFSLNALKVDASVRAAQADRCQKCALSCSGSGFVNEAGARFQREAHTATLETEIAEAQDIVVFACSRCLLVEKLGCNP